jgi:N-acetyl-gamma-glutamyl-phosphate reductase
MVEEMRRVGVVGASGYLGTELLRLCAQHPELRVDVATGDTQAGVAVGELYPSLGAAYPHLTYSAYDAADFDGLDLVFLALPHGASQQLVPDLCKRVDAVVDLAADFRLKDASLYPRWYGEEHHAPDLLADFSYGLPELFRDDVAGARAVAVAGCYPTAAGLALTPLVRAGVVEKAGIVVDAASGVSGAGRGKFPFCGTDEDFVAYGLLDHRHTPEMEQVVGASVLFTPHLAPMNRGILATCYARPAATTSTEALMGVLHDAYDDEPFVVVADTPPSTKATLGSNTAHLTARYDERTGWVLVLCALDNLVKGGSGQAIQCANLVTGLDETVGLPVAGIYP